MCRKCQPPTWAVSWLLQLKHVIHKVADNHHKVLFCFCRNRVLDTQVLGRSWEKDEAMAWTAVMALLTHSASAVYEAAENAETELAEAGDVEISTGTNTVAAEKGHLVDTCGPPTVNGSVNVDEPIQDITNKMQDVEFGSDQR